MFSRKMAMIVGAIILIAVNIIVLSVNSKRPAPSTGIGRFTISLVSPFQGIVSEAINSVKDIWKHYFLLVSVSKENAQLNRSLKQAEEKNNRLVEMELSHARLKRLFDFQGTLQKRVVAAEVIGRDPSPWFKTIIINKGSREGVERGMPVVIPEGIAGLVTDVARNYAKILLVIDQNNAVDALIQRTRARGIIKGEPSGRLMLQYVLRKHEIQVGDVVISSGLDGVFPKGIRIGFVREVNKPDSGIFQQLAVTPYADFEKLEEVLVVLDPPEQPELDDP
ncbi:MAG: rod shape-determining protein MreC [Deltaproteobacteria bacterium]|nr:rod shape-determining protein MreC [Deltaproteobacteria bacterium]MBW2176522.1 rod shape-determining protein MreC [Deltaproteobacteria bacterium]MBW2296922.1 rod shape-determining protein MreC [Deltaproteobacteria bacterium]MBW2613749.1 rod shape-determining protein MreC [Deltaproteobacteria bacterium]MBW2676594.1 rod shape-determining protein MreC [Deltaproteobacteria bacterium]